MLNANDIELQCWTPLFLSFLHVTQQSDNAWQVSDTGGICSTVGLTLTRSGKCTPYSLGLNVSSQYNLGHLTRSKVADRLPLVYSANCTSEWGQERKQGAKHRGPTARNQCTNMAEVTSAFTALSTRSHLTLSSAKSLYHLHWNNSSAISGKRNSSEDMHLTFREQSNESSKLTSCRTWVSKISIKLTSASLNLPNFWEINSVIQSRFDFAWSSVYNNFWIFSWLITHLTAPHHQNLIVRRMHLI